MFPFERTLALGYVFSCTLLAPIVKSKSFVMIGYEYSLQTIVI